MGFDEEMEDSLQTIILTDEHNTEEEFAIIDSVEYKGTNYILVIETALLDDESADAMILKKVGESEKDVNYELIEDDDEFDKVAELFSAKNEEYDMKIED